MKTTIKLRPEEAKALRDKLNASIERGDEKKNESGLVFEYVEITLWSDMDSLEDIEVSAEMTVLDG